MEEDIEKGSEMEDYSNQINIPEIQKKYSELNLTQKEREQELTERKKFLRKMWEIRCEEWIKKQGNGYFMEIHFIQDMIHRLEEGIKEGHKLNNQIHNGQPSPIFYNIANLKTDIEVLTDWENEIGSDWAHPIELCLEILIHFKFISKRALWDKNGKKVVLQAAIEIISDRFKITKAKFGRKICEKIGYENGYSVLRSSKAELATTLDEIKKYLIQNRGESWHEIPR